MIRQVLSQDTEMMVVSFTFGAGAKGPLHRHPHVQASYVEAGRFRFTVGRDSFEVGPGSVFYLGVGSGNTMPARTHDRRMEAYLDFDLAPDARVFHLTGRPDQTRQVVMADEEAVLSPPWSIHSGAGTGSYSFCWAMAGDNVEFTDMDMVAMEGLR